MRYKNPKTFIHSFNRELREGLRQWWWWKHPFSEKIAKAEKEIIIVVHCNPLFFTCCSLKWNLCLFHIIILWMCAHLWKTKIFEEGKRHVNCNNGNKMYSEQSMKIRTRLPLFKVHFSFNENFILTYSSAQ